MLRFKFYLKYAKCKNIYKKQDRFLKYQSRDTFKENRFPKHLPRDRFKRLNLKVPVILYVKGSDQCKSLYHVMDLALVLGEVKSV